MSQIGFNLKSIYNSKRASNQYVGFESKQLPFPSSLCRILVPSDPPLPSEAPWNIQNMKWLSIEYSHHLRSTGNCVGWVEEVGFMVRVTRLRKELAQKASLLSGKARTWSYNLQNWSKWEEKNNATCEKYCSKIFWQTAGNLHELSKTR